MAAETITFTPDRRDAECVQAAQLERLEQLAQDSSYTLVLIALALVVPIASYVAAGLIGFQDPVRDDAALAISAGFALGLLTNYIVMRTLQRAGFRRQAALLPGYLATQTLSLGERGLEVRVHDVGSSLINWATIDDAVMRDGQIFVWQGPYVAAYAPLSAFESPEAADRVAAEIVRRAAAARHNGETTISGASAPQS